MRAKGSSQRFLSTHAARILARAAGQEARRQRRRRGTTARVAALALLAPLLYAISPAVSPAHAQAASCGTGDPAKVAGTCTVTIAANDFATGAPLANFTYIINVDN